MPRRFIARFAENTADVRAAQRLRGQVFRGGGLDKDRFDETSRHVLVEDHQEGRLVCAFRLLPLASGAAISESYAAQFYNLSGLMAFPGKMLELGRFCMAAGATNPDILRTAWAAITAYVDENNIEILFGCSSFKGTDPKEHLTALAALKARHIAPPLYRPEIKAPQVFDFSNLAPPGAGASTMPSLLRTYLMMGGWTSDHAVIDHDLGTLHVFTGLEIAKIPESRKRLLRAAVEGI